jgi:hypothetical protein
MPINIRYAPIDGVIGRPGSLAVSHVQVPAIVRIRFADFNHCCLIMSENMRLRHFS